MKEPRAQARAAVIAFVCANPGCSSQRLTDEMVAGRVTSAILAIVLRDLRKDGVLVTVNQRNTIAAEPTTDEEAAAVAHLKAHGAIGAEVLRLARELGARPFDLLQRRCPGRTRAIIIAQLRGAPEEIAAALKMKPRTVEGYQPKAGRVV